MIESALEHILTGRSHAHADALFDGLDWRAAGKRPADSPYSIWQLLAHMVYWQDFLLAELRGESPAMPAHAQASWPEAVAPKDEDEWVQTVTRFRSGLEEAHRHLASGDLDSPIMAHPQSRAETLSSLASHNSYHGGQVVILRRMLGSWPPSSGGNTW